MKPPLKQCLCLALISIVCSSAFAQPWIDALLGPSVLQIREAAKMGDPIAQEKLGSAYLTHGDRTNALMWFKRSARQGNAKAQLEVGNVLLGDGIFKPLGTTKDGLKWIFLSANQNYLLAQLQLGRMYERGHLVPKDDVEAFKWYALITKQHSENRVYMDNLSLKLSDAQIAEGQKRAAAFKPAPPAPVPLEIKLQGISGTGAKKLAIINGHTFAAGETASVKAEEESLSIKCLEIADNSAIVQINGNRQTLLLPSR